MFVHVTSVPLHAGDLAQGLKYILPLPKICGHFELNSAETIQQLMQKHHNHGNAMYQVCLSI